MNMNLPWTDRMPETMTAVRHQVDRLDRKLVRLLVRRQALMEAAAHIKSNRDDVLDRDRIEAIIVKVRAEAGRKGLSVDIAEPVWRVLIDRCIAHEFKTFDMLRPNTQKPGDRDRHNALP